MLYARTCLAYPRPFSHAGVAAALLLLACGSAAADCTCRAGGRDYNLGERICIAGPSGPRAAVCGMNQNVSSWIFDQEPCRVSARPASLRLAADGGAMDGTTTH
ncbi:hypothetical protein [Ancylobacter pratisalsi]|uniref:DUF333 domain-containing protein n=1 Tax=Ancylobacter pratisalsi TaxID=1745854 RepID=A0A6P1YJ71_9HYPH|nr:hypothetical protein [Ancylobacter pratisalsi]QIB32746.1 hypothetical protein G3A50_02765 [Ancylobacter pratisalsi]